MLDDITSGACILNDGVVHHDNTAGQRRILSMGDMNKGNVQFALQLFQLVLDAHAQKRVQRRQGCVQHQFGFGDQRGNALLLPRPTIARASRPPYPADQMPLCGAPPVTGQMPRI